MSNVFIPAGIRDKATRDTLIAIVKQLSNGNVTIAATPPNSYDPGAVGDIIYASSNSSIWIFDGDEWTQGPIGPTGPTGPAGPAGADGATGTDGADGSDAIRYASRRLYIASTSTPVTPSATITWSTGALSNITSGWSLTAPTKIATSTTDVYFSDILFVDSTAPFTTTVATGTTPIEGTSFSGLVTFNSGDFSLDGSTITSIDGGNITAGSLSGGSGGAITAGTPPTGSQEGFSLNLTNGKMTLGDATNYVNWNGTDLAVKGSISADSITSGTISTDRLELDSLMLSINSNGQLTLGDAVISQLNFFTGTELTSSDTGYAVLNGYPSFNNIVASDYISAGETLIVPSGFWVWSNSTSSPAITMDVNNGTLVNLGRISGKGGGPGSAGGTAISVTGSNVAIINGLRSLIAGGGGGGGTNGGGGAGQSTIGLASVTPSSTGSVVIGQCGGTFGCCTIFGTRNVGLGGPQGGGGHAGTTNIAGSCYATGNANNPGPNQLNTSSSGVPVAGVGASGGSVLNSGSNFFGQGSGGGGGWGNTGLGAGAGAGGAAITGTYVSYTDDGTTYGAI